MAVIAAKIMQDGHKITLRCGLFDYFYLIVDSGNKLDSFRQRIFQLLFNSSNEMSRWFTQFLEKRQENLFKMVMITIKKYFVRALGQVDPSVHPRVDNYP